jgi:hypothetical protein
MSSYSIYQKPCPACGTAVSTGIKRCDCGYAFGYSDETALLPEELALQEEELFEAYLAARVDQTVAKVESFRSELMADPANLRKANRRLKLCRGAILRDEQTPAAKTAQARKRLRRQEEKCSATPDVRFNPTVHRSLPGPASGQGGKSSRHSSIPKPRIVRTARLSCPSPPRFVSADIIFRAMMSCCPGPWTVPWAREALAPNKFRPQH